MGIPAGSRLSSYQPNKNMQPQIKSVLYCRVSSKEQEETGYSLDAQEKLLKEYAAKNNFSICKIFRNSESASGKQVRQTFEEMLNYTNKRSVPVILCEKIDRLTRNLKDASVIDSWIKADSGRSVHFVKESFVLNDKTKAHENLVWDMKVAIARFYTNNLSEEVKKGQKEKIAQGWLPARAKLGYKTVGEKGHRTHIVSEAEAPFIKRMFELYASGNYSLKALVETMQNEGMRNEYGRKIPKSRMHKMLSDPFYCGKIQWKGQIYDGQHQPIVSQELFDKANFILKRKKAPTYSKHLFTFRKMIRCGECGGIVTGEIKKGHVYYHCSHYKGCSQRLCTREEEIEKKIIGIFDFFKSITPKEAEEIKDKIKANHAKEAEYKENALKGLYARYEALQKRLDRLYDDRLDARIAPEMWERKQGEINAEQAVLKEQIGRIKDEETKYFEIGINILDLARRAAEIYEKRSPEEKRMLLSHIFLNLILKDGNVAYSLTKPVEKIAKRVQEKLDVGKNFEQNQNTAIYSDALSINPSSYAMELSEPRNNFRTSRKSPVKAQFGNSIPESRPLLRRLDSNQRPSA